MSQPTFIEGVGYEGKVTLTLKSNGHTISTKTYKNNGTANLFKFLGHCLMDDYATAKAYLPYQIMLLNNESMENPKSAALKSMSSYIPLQQQPTWGNPGGADEVSVIYSFEVPKTSIDTAGTFNQVALYRKKPDDFKDFSAYYFLKDADGNLEGQDVSEWSSTTVLLVEWELILSNTGVVTSNTPSSGGDD